MTEAPAHSATRVTLATAPAAGAVALLQLHGPRAEEILATLTGRRDWPPQRLRLVKLADIDEGLAVLLVAGEHGWVQLMPHGGPRVVQRLIDRLLELGAAYETAPDARAMFPEAQSAIEAGALLAVSRAASPAAIDLLLAQPRLWHELVETGGRSPAIGEGPFPTPSLMGEGRGGGGKQPTSIDFTQILTTSQTLQRLLDPPAVVVVGRPNVGKSTLTNRMFGHSASIVADLPGTTRDWVAGIAELTPDPGPLTPDRTAIAVRWMDTPGLRHSDDPIEQHAIALARQAIDAADVLIALRDVATDWPDDATLARRPDLWCVNKIDTMADPPAGDGESASTPLGISAATGEGIDTLQARIVTQLGLDDLSPGRLWAFSAPLAEACGGEDADSIRAYVQCAQ